MTVVDNLQTEDALPPKQWPQHLQCHPEAFQFMQEDYLEFFLRMDSALFDHPTDEVEDEDEPNKKKNEKQHQEWTVFMHLATVMGSTIHESFSIAAQQNFAVDNAVYEWVTADKTKRIIKKMIALHSNVPEIFMSPSSTSTSTSTSSGVRIGVSHILSKQSGRFLAPALHKTHGLNAVLYEAPYIYGEDQPTSAVLRSLVRQALARTDPIVLQQDMNVDIVYVEDVVQSVFESINSVFNGSVVSLASREPLTNMAEVARLVAQQMGDEAYAPSISVNNVLSADMLPSFPSSQTLTCQNLSNMEAVIAYMISLQQQTDDDLNAAAHEKEKQQKDLALYSSFQCSGGNQKFPDMTPHNEDSLSYKNKVCKLENVCLQGTTMMYFQHPEEAMAPDFVQVQDLNMVMLGIVHDMTPAMNFHLTVLPDSPVPGHFEFTDAKTWFLILASFSDGVGHHLLDDLYPVLAAMDIFDVPYEDVGLTYTGCEILDHFNEVCVYDYTKYRGEVCHDNFDFFSKLIFDTHAIPLGNVMNNKNDVKCFKSLVVGQNYVFNVDTVDKQRAVTLRKGRDLIIKHLQNNPKHLLYKELEVYEDELFVLVLPKNNPGFQEDVLWPNMCEDILALLQGLNVGVGKGVTKVVCSPSGYLPREMEMTLINKAAVIVAEHGTLSLLAGFYGSDGTVLITVGTNDAIKSAETLPFALHIYVLYTTMEKLESLPSLLRYGLHLAAKNRNITLKNAAVNNATLS